MLFAPYANVAQSVEQLIRNQQVAGSIPAVSSKKLVRRCELERSEKLRRDLLKGLPQIEKFVGRGECFRKVRGFAISKPRLKETLDDVAGSIPAVSSKKLVRRCELERSEKLRRDLLKGRP